MEAVKAGENNITHDLVSIALSLVFKVTRLIVRTGRNVIPPVQVHWIVMGS